MALMAPLRPSKILRRLAAHARSHPRNTLANIVSLGRILLAAKGVLPYGEFESWLRSIAPRYSLRTAREAMMAARRLEVIKDLPLAKFQVSALRVVGRREVVGEWELREALSAAAKRGPVGFSHAREVVSGLKPAAIYGGPSIGSGLTNEERKEAERQRVESLDLSKRLGELLDDSAVFGLNITSDGDKEMPNVTVVVQGVTKKIATGRTIIEAIRTATGVEEIQVCRKCLFPRPVVMFSKNTRRCKLCERERVAAHAEKKKGMR